MLLVLPPAHTNIPLATATQCCLFWCDFQQWVMLPLLVPRMVACRTTLTTIEESWEDDEVQIVWAKAGRGIRGLGHVFEGKLYFTKDIVDDNFVPRNGKPKPIPKPEAKPAPKPAPKGKHVQLFQMRRKIGKGFYSTAADALDGQWGCPEHAEICLHIVL